jgi:hypothetical protein
MRALHELGALRVQAALAYDIAAVKCRGPMAITNFDVSEYQQELDNLDSVRWPSRRLSLSNVL